MENWPWLGLTATEFHQIQPPPQLECSGSSAILATAVVSKIRQQEVGGLLIPQLILTAPQILTTPQILTMSKKSTGTNCETTKNCWCYNIKIFKQGWETSTLWPSTISNFGPSNQ